MNEHKKFEILCALAVIGQVSDADLRELTQHIEGCVDCQNRISDFAQISAQALPLAGERYVKPRSPKKMTARFVERARAEGIRLRDSEQIVPSYLSLVSLGWSGRLAAALLLIAIIVGGISRVVHSRSQSADIANSARLEQPTHQFSQTEIMPSQTEILQNRSTSQDKKRPNVSMKMTVSNARHLGPAHNPRRPWTGSELEDGSVDPAQVLLGIKYSGTQYQAAFNEQIFSSDVKSRELGFFQAYGSSSDRPWLDASSLMLARPSQILSAADPVGADSRDTTGTFAIISLNFPPQFFAFGPNRPLLNYLSRTQAELDLNIDWNQVRRAMRSKSLQNSNDFSQYHPSVIAPVWPFSKEAEGEQQ